MLAEMTPEQMDEWIAFAELEPIGQRWLQTGTVAAAVDSGFTAIMAGFSDAKIGKDDWPQATDYLPTRKGRQAGGPRIDLDSVERAAKQVDQVGG